MVLVPNPAGGSMNVTSTADALSKGWTPAMGTFGQSPDSGGGGIGQSSGGGGAAPASSDQSAILAAFAASSGATVQDLAERKRQFDATLDWQKQMWTQQGLPQLQIQQQAAALAQQEFESQKQIAAQNFQLAQQTQGQKNAADVASLTGWYNAPADVPLAGTNAPWTPGGLTGPGGNWGADTGWDPKGYVIGSDGMIHNGSDGSSTGIKAAAGAPVGMAGATLGALANATPAAAAAPVAPGQGVQTLAGQQQQALLSGMYNGAPTEAAREFNTSTGLDYLKTAASLGGPADYFQQSNFLRGASANPNVPTFLSALNNNTGVAAFNAPSGTAPAVQSMSGLSGGLLGGGAAINPQGALTAIGQLGTRGGQALSPQAIESLSPDELELLKSGLKASGFSTPSFLNAYAQSRVGQQSAQAA